MEYTTNFGLKKPIRGVDPRASIDDLNDNAEDIDTIMYQNRTMLGEAYDPNKVDGYTEGDFVVQLGQFYECISDTSGVWNPTAWQLTDIGTVLKALAGGGSGGHTYSTQEQIVGKWIDGKNLYEKTVVSEVALTGSWQNYVPSSDMDTIISVEARCTRDGEDAQMVFSNSEVASWLNRDNYIKVCTPTNSNDWKILSMTVRYTKSSS